MFSSKFYTTERFLLANLWLGMVEKSNIIQTSGLSEEEKLKLFELVDIEPASLGDYHFNHSHLQ